MDDRYRARNSQGELPGIMDDLEPDREPVPNSMVCGDSRVVLRSVPEESVHLVVTSPPYWDLADYGFSEQIGHTSYQRYLDDLLAVWRECERILVPNGKLCINVPIIPVPKARTPDNHTRELKNLAADIEHSIISQLSLKRYSPMFGRSRRLRRCSVPIHIHLIYTRIIQLSSSMYMLSLARRAKYPCR